MKFNKKLAALAAALTLAVTMSGCAAAKHGDKDENQTEISEGYENEIPSTEQTEGETPVVAKPAETEVPKITKVSYITVTANSVNIRSGAGTEYQVLGVAEKNTLYACLGEENGWYKTYYKHKTAYISKKYCTAVDLDRSENEKIEAVISEGTKCLGAPYVYGAVRLHDGKGNMLKGFNENAFDCSSLMQYMFYKGADKLLQVNTRTQIEQGTAVLKENLKRGDLIFFTNASRKDNVGIERVGHVAMYLGGNYILHTASDYAKIEQISTTRWGYYIQAQRMI